MANVNERDLTLRQLQQEQVVWQEHNFPSRDNYYPLLGAMEELGELAHAHLKSLQKIRGSAVEHRAKASDAVADIVIFLADYCSANGIDFQDALNVTWEMVSKRDWKRDPVSGGKGE